MALTKKQKSSLIDEATKKLNESHSAVFTEFNAVSVEDFKKLRRELKKSNADLKILKKTLLDLALKNLNAGFNPLSKKSQLATIFSKGDVSSVAATIYKFSKELAKAKKGEFSVMGAYDLAEKRLIDADEFKAIATLPSREILLAQVAMMLTMPLKQLMMAVNERSKNVQ